MKTIAIYGIAFMVLILLPRDICARQWKTQEGSFDGVLLKVLVHENAKTVAIRKFDDTILILPFTLFSIEDQSFIDDYQAGKIDSGGNRKGVLDPLTRDMEVISRVGNKSSKVPEKYAILIGVDRYPNIGSTADLKYCSNDMNVLGELLSKNGFSPENVFIMTSDGRGLPPTKKNIEYQVSSLLSLVTQGDTVVVAFSGHGVRFESLDNSGYLCPQDMGPWTSDATEASYSQSLVSRDWIDRELNVERLQKVNRLLIVDACRNDPLEKLSRSSGTTKNITFRTKNWDPVGSDKNTYCVIASCSVGEKSQELRKFCHGAFVYYFLQGLKGQADQDLRTGNKDGEVSAREAFQYASDHVRDLEFMVDGKCMRQHPVQHFSRADEDFCLTVVTTDTGSDDKVSEGNKRKAGSSMTVSVGGVDFLFSYCPPGRYVARDREKDMKLQATNEKEYGEISQGYWILQTEVTVGMYRLFVRESGYVSKSSQPVIGYDTNSSKLRTSTDYSWRVPGFEQTENHPVVCVSYSDCLAFCKWLSDKTGHVVSLPAEDQWEYACRAGTDGPVAGSGLLDQMGWYGANSRNATHHVAQLSANAWGIFDMHGNAREWCLNDFGQDTHSNDSVSVRSKVVRGGSWRDRMQYCSSEFRGGLPPESRNCMLGFRIVLNSLRPGPTTGM